MLQLRKEESSVIYGPQGMKFCGYVGKGCRLERCNFCVFGYLSYLVQSISKYSM
jgi:hypothetical protein